MLYLLRARRSGLEIERGNVDCPVHTRIERHLADITLILDFIRVVEL